MVKEENRQSTLSLSQDKVAPLPRNRKAAFVSSGSIANRTTPMPPPRRANSQQRFVFTHLIFYFCFFFFVFGFLSLPPYIIFLFQSFFICNFFFLSFSLPFSPAPFLFNVLMRVFGDGIWCLGFVHFDGFIIIIIFSESMIMTFLWRDFTRWKIACLIS